MRTGERGSAVVELVVLLVAIVVPLVHLLVGFVEVQATAVALEAAAQHAARTGAVASGASWREAALEAVAGDLPGRRVAVEVTDADGDGALGRGEYLDVVVEARLLPAPPLPWSVHVEARGVARADPCRSIPGAGTHVEVPATPAGPGCPV